MKQLAYLLMLVTLGACATEREPSYKPRAKPFQVMTPEEMKSVRGHPSIGCVDIDNDGDMDIVTYGKYGMLFLRNDGNGKYTMEIIKY